MTRRGLTRRAALAGLAAVPAGWALDRGTWGLARPASPPDLEELARIFRTAQREAVLDRAVDAMRAGAGLGTVLGATFLAGIQEVRPRHVGGKLHCVMVIESAFQLAAVTDERSAGQLALWCLDDFKRSQALDEGEGDWTLPPRPEVAFATEAEARREFEAAMERWDEAMADRALVGLLPFHTQDSLFEILWPYAARSYVNLGHKIIFAAQTDRTLRRIGWAHAEPVLRSLVYGLLHQPDGRQMDAWNRSLALQPARAAQGEQRVAAPQTSAALLKDWRARDAQELPNAAAAALGEGADSAAAWDALRLLAAEVFLARRSSRPAQDVGALLPVHAVTVVNAFGHAARRTQSATASRLMFLQAAGWLPQLRADLIGMAGLRRDGPRIDNGERPVPDVATLVRELALKGVEHHQHKYAAAILDEHRVADPLWAPLLLTGALPYLPGEQDEPTDIGARAERALKKLGS